jgi:alpha-glucosidase (family GH31 glycosyl hydrolase)
MESSWGLDYGLASVLTQALAMGLIGYPFILPDMVGGNEYEFKADEELFLRWVELNTWLPMVQFSLLPWRDGYGEVVNETTKAYMDFRATLNDYILALADEAASGQMPMVRPLFFSFPEDEKSYAIGDQFMFGELYLVAPVLTQGAVARDVYLPPGRWIPMDMPSGSPGEPVDGPKVLEQWPAPLGKIPVFRRAE